MSNHKYPRFDSWGGMKKNTTAKCDATGCDKLAIKRIFVQESYMRGDDQCVKACADNAAIKDCVEFCKQFPPEAWK